MTPEERAHALELTSELLSDIELDRIPLDKLLLKGARLARLASDEEFSSWIRRELNAYSTKDFDGKLWRMTQRGRDEEDAIYAGAAYLASSTAILEEELRSLRLPNLSGDNLTVPLSQTRQHIVKVRNMIVKYNRVITAVRGVLHEYTSKHFYSLRFSVHQGEMFDAAKASIDALLDTMPGDALQKIDSAYRNIKTGDPESIAGAMNSVRRLIDSAADALFPATKEIRRGGDGKEIKLGEQQRLNRIKAYVDDHVESKGRGDRLKRSLSDIYARVSSGVHNNVTAAEATHLFLSTYVLLGEVMTLPEDGNPEV
ncbi:hypothetical protein [Streptomyces althioticus]|uniref:AbiTii domain-containing protein n=1 Tax=Streptomyces althioticus TaxID=83380 RepID=UPI0033EF4D9C